MRDLEGFVAKRDKVVLMGKMGSSFDVAYSVAFLASSQKRYITAQKLVVHDGITFSTG